MKSLRNHVPDLTHRPVLAALLGYGLLAALFYAPVLLGQRTFHSGDFTDHFLPFSLFQRSELLAGRLSLWNPYTYAGHPFLADVQAAVFYPLSNLLLALTLPWGSAAARLYWLEIEAILQVALAGFFIYLLAWELIRKRLPAFLAGCVFAFSGYLSGYPPLQLAVLRTAIWLPLILWLLLRAARSQQWRWWAIAALASTCAFLAGHPQTFLYLSYATVAWMALLGWGIWRQGPASGRLPRFVAGVAIFYTLMLGLSAAQLLPSLEFTRLSVRAHADYAFLSGGFTWSETWQIVLPGLVSSFSPLYVGIAGLGLAGAAVVWAARPRESHSAPSDLSLSQRRLIAFFALLTLLAWLVSYGRHGFVYPFVYRWLPGWNLFQGQERAAYGVAFGLSMLVGYGAALLPDFSPRARRWLGVVTLGLSLAGVVIFFIFWQKTGQSGATGPEFIRAAATTLIAAIAFAFILWRQRWQRTGVLVLLAIVVVADLFLTNVGTITAPRSPAVATALPPATLALQAAVQEQATATPPAGRVYNEGRVFEDYGMSAGVEDAWGSSPLRLARYASLFADFPVDRAWRLTGVHYVLSAADQTARLSARDEAYRPSQLLGAFPAGGEDAETPTYLHRLTDPNPRAWLVTEARIWDDAAARPWLADARLDLATTVILPPATDPDGGSIAAARTAGHPPLLLTDGLLAASGQNAVAVQRLTPGHMRLDVQSEHGGLLLVSENWMPGWQATQRSGDGTIQQLPVLRADLAFLGIPVGSGQSAIDLVYRPASVRWGLLISCLTLALLLLLTLWRRRLTDMQPALRVWGPRLLLLAILGAGWAARLYHLDFQELRGDEAFGYFFSLSPLRTIIQETLALQEPHPVASYFWQHLWLSMAGRSEFALRFTSAWFGVLAVALLYRVGRQLHLGRATALLAAALLSLSPYAIWHAQDARMYSLSLALTLASTSLALTALRRPRWRAWLAYILVTWLTLLTHYFTAFIVLAQNLFILGGAMFMPDLRRIAGRWLVAQSVLALLYLPWLLVAYTTLTGYGGNGDSPGFGAMWLRALSVFAVGETLPAEQRLRFAVLAGLLLVFGVIRLASAGTRGRRALALLTFYLLVPLLATWLSATNRPIFNERYLVAAAPPFFLLAATAVTGAQSLARRRYPFLGLASLIVLGLLLLGVASSLQRHYTDPAYSKTRGWRQLAVILDRFSAGLPPDQMRLVQNFPDPTLWYYYNGPALHLVLPPAAHDEAATTAEVAKLSAQGVERLVLAAQPEEWWDERRIAAAALAQHYALLAETQVGVWPVQVYTRPPAVLPPVGAAFSNGLTLMEASISAQRLLPGDTLAIYLRWQGTPDMLQGSEKITLQLLDAGGRLATQVDQPFGVADLATEPARFVMPLPQLLPPGDYRLILALYDPAQPNAPRLLTTDGADHVELGAYIAISVPFAPSPAQ